MEFVFHVLRIGLGIPVLVLPALASLVILLRFVWNLSVFLGYPIGRLCMTLFDPETASEQAAREALLPAQSQQSSSSSEKSWT